MLKIKKWILSWFDFLSVLFIDPILFGFVLYLIFTRIQSVIERAIATPQRSFELLLELDMQENLGIYIGFIIVFIIWMIAKTRQHNERVKEQCELIGTLKAINDNIQTMNTRLDALNTKIDDMNTKINTISNNTKKHRKESKQ